QCRANSDWKNSFGPNCRSLASMAQRKKWVTSCARDDAKLFCGRLLFQLRTAEKRQHEQVDRDVHKQTSKHCQTEALGWRKFRQNEYREPRANDHIGIDNSTPLLFATCDPYRPALFAIAPRPTHSENQMDHGIDSDTNADVCRW